MPHCRNALLLLLLCVALSGCGSSEFVPVSGKVTLAGKPLTTGTVTLISTTGRSIGYGAIQPDGTFTISTGKQSGLKPGEYKASVVSTTVAAPQAADQSEPIPALLTPAKYADAETSGLKYQIAVPGKTLEIAL